MNELVEPGPNGRTLIKAQRDGPVLRLVLDNPPANVLSVAVMESLRAGLEAAGDDEAVKVIVLAACGKVFSAGHDLKEMTSRRFDADGGRSYFEHVFGLCSKLMQMIVGLPKPVIAEVDGIATAAGCQLVASCDLAFASDQSRFGVNGIDVGLFCSTPAVALTRNISAKRAMKMLLTGELIDASTALEFGLLNAIAPRHSLEGLVQKHARIIASKSPVAVKLGKDAVYRQSGIALAQAYERACKVMVENMMAADAKEGISAFFEKREPKWGQ